MKSSVFTLSIPLALCVFLHGCAYIQTPKPNVLLIVTEKLGTEAIPCNADRNSEVHGGFETLCRESIRFHHAFANSPVPLNTFGSLFSGQSAAKLGMGSGNTQFLNEKLQTVAEAAIQKGYSTAMFSGGPPVFRKSGLDQGFEVFDDQVNLNEGHFFRPVGKLTEEYLGWVSETDERSHFATLYLADLLFPTVSTLNDLGTEREKSFDSQLEEVGESLGSLFQKMKSRKIWDHTVVILVGLTGDEDLGRTNEIPALNLHGNRLGVTLFIKPVSPKKRDEPLIWNIDENVSHSDLGGALMRFFDQKTESNFDLFEALKSPEPRWKLDRVLEFYSGWAQSLGLGEGRFAFRSNFDLLIWDQPPRIFNTLTDRWEVSSMPWSSRQATDGNSWQEQMKLLERPRFLKLDYPTTRKFRFASRYFSNLLTEYETLAELEGLYLALPEDLQIKSWALRHAVTHRNWKLFRKLAKRYKDPTLITLSDVIEERPTKSKPQGCLHFFFDQKMGLKKDECEEEELNLLSRWITNAEEDKGQTEKNKEAFIQAYNLRALQRQVFKLQFINGFLWPLPSHQTLEPTWSEIFLAMPQNSRIYNQVKSRIYNY